jgi:RimJ/RimL family protein N-acetyltransferase
MGRVSAVALREVRRDDLPVLFSHQADPDSSRMAMVPSRDRAAFDAHWEKLLEDPEVLTRAVVAGGALAGHVGAWNRDGERQVGYCLGRAFWGRGIATEALRQLLALEHHRPLSAHVAKTNAGSARVLEKCGFVFQSASFLVVDDAYQPAKVGISFVDLLYRLHA